MFRHSERSMVSVSIVSTFYLLIKYSYYKFVPLQLKLNVCLNSVKQSSLPAKYMFVGNTCVQ